MAKRRASAGAFALRKSARPSTTAGLLRILLVAALALLARPNHAQSALDPFATPPPATAADQLTTPTLRPGLAFLFSLEAEFAHDTATGGGPAFARWFAPDAVTLSNGKAPVTGHAAIAAAATWSPGSYQLSWTPTGGELARDMGYTWGHYTGVATNPDGARTTTSGRYLTIWRKQPNGQWKVALDTSSEDALESGTCCRLP